MAEQSNEQINALVAEKVMGQPQRVIPEGEDDGFGDCLKMGGPTWVAVVQSAIDAGVELRQSHTYKGTTYEAIHDGWLLRYTDSDNYKASETVKLEGKPINWWSTFDGSLYVFPAEPAPYATDPTTDYLVLCHVRETWSNKSQFAHRNQLQSMWYDRGLEREKAAGKMLVFGPNQYEPGDYARAALAALEQQGEPEGEQP